MRSTDTLFARHIAVAIAACAIGAGPVLANALVVRSSGPSAGAFPPGKMLPDTAKIALKTYDQITLLDEHGTRTLRGPGTFSALATASAEPSGGTALAAIVDQRTDRRVRIGAVRGPEAVAKRPPSLWSVDTSHDATFCVSDPAQVALWRPASDAAGDTMISDPGGGSTTISWTPGEANQPWPASLPITAGARYRLATAGSPPVTVQFSLIGDAPADMQGTAETLIQHGCRQQLDLLVDTASAVTAASTD